LMATIAFAFATTFFPFATLFFDHNLTAAFMLAAFYFLCPLGAAANRNSAVKLRRDEPAERTRALWVVAAGFCAGFAAITNYVAAVVVGFLALYLLLGLRAPGSPLRWRDLILFGAGLLGPSLVGLSVSYIGIGGCFYVNVISYLAVIGALMRMHVPNVVHHQHASVIQSLTEAFGYVRRENVIMTFLTVSAIFNIFGRSYVTLLPVFAKDVLQLGASGFGFISAGPGLGTIIGSFTLASLGRVEAKPARMVGLLVGFTTCLFSFAVSRDARLAFGFLVAVGALSTLFETLLNTSIQLRVEEAFRGRVSGFYGLTGGGLREFGGMQAGFIAEWTSAPVAISAGAVALALIGYMFLNFRVTNWQISRT